MKNVLFIGPYNLQSGWGEASRRYLSVLAKCDINLCCSPIYMSSGTIQTNFHEIEQNKSISYDTIIQNVLPHLATRFHNSKNVLIADFETNHIEHTGWVQHINMMDEVWVDTLREKEILETSGVTIPIKVIVMPVDLSQYNIELNYNKLKDLQSKVVFYFVGEYTERKNVRDLVTAFNREFHYTDNALLVIKTSLGNLNPNKVTDYAVNDLGELKGNFRIYGDDSLYKSELLITERFSFNELFAMHSLAKCFVMPSRGESSCLPLLDAMYFNSHCIVTKNTGMETTVGPFNKYLVDSYETPVVCKSPPLPNIYTTRETWQQIDLLDLQKKMRAAYLDFPMSGGKEYISKVHGIDSLVPFYSGLING